MYYFFINCCINLLTSFLVIYCVVINSKQISMKFNHRVKVKKKRSHPGLAYFDIASLATAEQKFRAYKIHFFVLYIIRPQLNYIPPFLNRPQAAKLP